MGLGKIFALFRAPELDEEVKHLEEERSRMEAALRKKAQAAEAELNKLITHTSDVRVAAERKTNELGKAISSLRIPSVPDEFPSEPDTEAV